VKRVVATVALGTALVLAGAGCGGSTPAGGHGILLVGRAKYGRSRIFLWRPGSRAKPLGPAGYEITDPVWSPDGCSIAWVDAYQPEAGATPASDEISLMRSDGTQLKSLAEDDYYDGGPSWSPDGRHIVYERQGISGGEGLVIVDARSGHERVLHPRDLPEYARDAVWGKPGIAYLNDSGINLLNPEAGRSRLVAHGYFYNDGLAWSPSGVLAVFERKRIVVLSTSGRVLGKLLTPPSRCWPVWSPNGKQILVTAKANNVWVGTVSTKHWQRLTVPMKGNACATSWR